MKSIAKINPKLQVVLSNLVDRNDVFKMDISELREYFTDKKTGKLKLDVLKRISDLFEQMRAQSTADMRQTVDTVEEIPFACKILKPKEAFSLSLAKLSEADLLDIYDKKGVVVEANKLNRMVLVMFSEKHQVWVPRNGIVRTQGNSPSKPVPKKSERPVSKYLSAAQLREKISTRSTSPRERERSRSRSQDKKLVRVMVKIPDAKELEEAKQRTRARLEARNKQKKRKNRRQRAKSQEQPRIGRGPLFASDAGPIRMPRRRAKSLTEVEKYQQQKNRITIGGLLQKTRDAKRIIADRNFKQRKGTGKKISYGPGAKRAATYSAEFEDGGGTYAPYNKLSRYEKMLAAQQMQQSGPVVRKRPPTGSGEPYQHPIYGDINVGNADYHHPAYSNMKQPDWDKLSGKQSDAKSEPEDYATQIKQRIASEKNDLANSSEPANGTYASQIRNAISLARQRSKEQVAEVPDVGGNRFDVDQMGGAQPGYNQDVANQAGGYNQGWGNSNFAPQEGPWGPNQGWGSQVPAAVNTGGPTVDENGETKVTKSDSGMDFIAYHDRLFSQHLNGMSGGANSGRKETRSLLERLNDKKNRVTLATLKDQKAGLTDQLRKFDMHAKVQKPNPANPRSKPAKIEKKPVDNRNLFERRRDAKQKHALNVQKLRNAVDSRKDLHSFHANPIRAAQFEITTNYLKLYEECVATFGGEIYTPETLRRLLGKIIHVHKTNLEKGTALFQEDEVIYELPRSCLTFIKS